MLVGYSFKTQRCTPYLYSKTAKQVDIQSARYTYIGRHKIILYANAFYKGDSIQRFLGSANWMSTFNPWILEQEDFYNYYYTWENNH